MQFYWMTLILAVFLNTVIRVKLLLAKGHHRSTFPVILQTLSEKSSDTVDSLKKYFFFFKALVVFAMIVNVKSL